MMRNKSICMVFRIIPNLFEIFRLIEELNFNNILLLYNFSCNKSYIKYIFLLFQIIFLIFIYFILFFFFKKIIIDNISIL